MTWPSCCFDENANTNINTGQGCQGYQVVSRPVRTMDSGQRYTGTADNSIQDKIPQICIYAHKL